MIELGKKDALPGELNLTKIADIRGKPEYMPTLFGDNVLVCGYDQGLGERMFLVEDLKDMQELHAGYRRGGALDIHWYKAKRIEVESIIDAAENTEE